MVKLIGYLIVSLLATAKMVAANNDTIFYETQALNSEAIGLNEPASIPTPNTTALAQYGIIPTSLHTGKANVSVPLYNKTVRGVNLNMELLYDTSGLLVNVLPSWTGHSWTLSIGGVISRTIKGRPDEFDTQNHSFPGVDLWKNYFHRYNGKITDPVEGWGDYMPDIFHFSFMGKSGKFFLGNDGNWKVASDENLMVEFDINDSKNYIKPFIDVAPNKLYQQPKSIKGFTLIDQEGNRYVFGGEQNAIEYSIDMREDNDGGNGSGINGEMYANSWYLTAVYDRFGVEIFHFEYERGLFVISSAICYKNSVPKMMINSPVYLSKVTGHDGITLRFVRDTQLLTSSNFYHRLYSKAGNNIKTLYNNLKLLQKGGNAYHYFIYLTNPAYTQYHNPNNLNKEYDPLNSMGMSPLKEIVVSNTKKILQRFSFEYNYSKNIRLHLKSLQIKCSDGTTDGIYKFKYNSFDKLPTIDGYCDYLSPYTDSWGYYNGVEDKKSFVDEEISQYGMLTEIEYPTGGVTTFEYNNHRYNSYKNTCRDGMVSTGGTSELAGGLCIRSITNYEDNTKSKELSKQVFFYQDGQLSVHPNIYLAVIENSNVGSVYGTFTPIPMANLFGYHIGYSTIYEEICSEETEIHKVYKYTNFSDYKDQSCWKDLRQDNLQDILAAYDEWTTRDYCKGRLLSLAILGEDDSNWEVTTYKYRQDFAVMEQDYVVGYMDKSLSAIARPGVLAEYHLFYPKYDIEEKTHLLRQDNYGFYKLTDVTKYDMKDVNITHPYGQAQMRLCNSETVSRAGTTKRVEYDYLQSGYYAPLVATRDYHNNVLTGGQMIEYGTFAINNKNILMPKYEKELFPSGKQSLVRTYHKYTNSYLPWEYSSKGQQKVTLTWNQFDQLLSYTIGDETTNCMYGDFGCVSKIILPNGNENNYEYDSMQRLVGTKDKYGRYLQKHKYKYRTGNN